MPRTPGIHPVVVAVVLPLTAVAEVGVVVEQRTLDGLSENLAGQPEAGARVEQRRIGRSGEVLHPEADGWAAELQDVALRIGQVILRNGEVDRLLVFANRALRQALEHRVVVAALVLEPDDLGRIDAAALPPKTAIRTCRWATARRD